MSLSAPEQPVEAQVPPSGTLAKNIGLNIGSRTLVIVLAFLATPFVLHRLGGNAFGIYALAISLSGLLAFLDLGLTPAVVTHLAKFANDGDDLSIQRLVGSALTLFLCIGALGAAVIALIVPWMVQSLFHVSPDLRSAAELSLWVSCAGFAANMCLSVFNAVPVALERYDLVGVRLTVVGLLTSSGLILYSLAGGSLVGFVVINVLSSGVGLVLVYSLARRLMPRVAFRPGLDTRIIRQVARFGVFKFFGSLSGVLTFRFDQFAIAAILGVPAVAFYAVPANATLRLHSLLNELAAPLFPRASTMRGKAAPVAPLFLKASRSMTLIAAPILILLAVFADRVLTYWIGGRQGEAVAAQGTAAMRWLLAAFLVQAVAAAPVVFCEALGMPEINNSFAVLGALLHVPLVLLLVPKFGIAGAGLALFINSATQTLTFVAVATRRLAGIGAFHLVRAAIFRPILAGGLIGGLAWISRPLVHTPLGLCLVGLALFGGYFALALIVGALGVEDVLDLRRGIGQIRKWDFARVRA